MRLPRSEACTAQIIYVKSVNKPRNAPFVRAHGAICGSEMRPGRAWADLFMNLTVLFCVRYEVHAGRADQLSAAGKFCSDNFVAERIFFV